MNIFKIITIIFLIFILPACTLSEINQQAKALDNLSVITGTVLTESDTQSPIIVALLQKNSTEARVIKQKVVSTDGNYKLYVKPGNYIIAAYIDTNQNKKRDKNEKAALYNLNGEKFTEIKVSKNEKQQLSSIIISDGALLAASDKLRYDLRQNYNNLGRVRKLNDTLFTPEHAELGLWRPIDFYQNIDGGLIFLSSFDANKIPVIFIHGIAGHPREFSKAVNQLDSEKFQPWVLFYPSGAQLTMISDYLTYALHNLHQRYQFEQVYIVSHSMGGLVSRKFIKQHQQTEQPYRIGLFVTINSPFLGMESAARSLTSSPIILPSWRDIATGSDFLKEINTWQLSPSIPYHLFFSYLPNEDGDGVVPLSSQLPLKLQQEALQIHGSEAHHSGLLNDDVFIQRLNQILAQPK